MEKLGDQAKVEEHLHPLRMRIALAIKMDGIDTASGLAKILGVSYEAIRQELNLMSKFELIEAFEGTSEGGRPSRKWAFTVQGEHLFPKEYDTVLDAILIALMDQKSKKNLKKLLQQLSSTKASNILNKSQANGLPAALKGLYRDSDPFIEIKTINNGATIIEKNCPILRVALKYPAICSVTTNALSKTFGKQVIRTKKFQNGDSQCVFVTTDKRYQSDFIFESDEKPLLSPTNQQR